MSDLLPSRSAPIGQGARDAIGALNAPEVRERFLALFFEGLVARARYSFSGREIVEALDAVRFEAPDLSAHLDALIADDEACELLAESLEYEEDDESRCECDGECECEPDLRVVDGSLEPAWAALVATVAA